MNYNIFRNVEFAADNRDDSIKGILIDFERV